MKTRFFALAALALSLAACTQDELAEGTLPEGEYPVVIRATGLSVEATPQAAPSTRATVDGDWQGVQAVALKMGDAVKEYTVTPNSADNTKATLSCENDPHYWTSRDPITVSAWWPLDNTDITRMPAVKVAEDQSKLADFQSSDFISAIDRTVEFDDPKLTFTHRTARVAIELKPGTGFTNVDDATVSLMSLSADNGNPTAIKTCNASGNSYEALTAPQTVTAGKPFIRVELGGGNFYFRPQNDVVLEAGNRYTYTVKVNATGLTLEGCTIGGWADGGSESGDAEELDYIYDESTNTYIVYSADGLLLWAEAVQKDKSTDCTLAANIDLTGKEWTPVCTKISKAYTGILDGDGHTITGLTINQSRMKYVGLIGYLDSNGKVQNLTLENVNITGYYYVGGVVGFNNSGTVTVCKISGNVSGSSKVGGVVGQNNSIVTSCTVSCSVSGNYTGGVVGNNSGTVTSCTASGDVTGESFSVGGVVGQNSGTVTACTAYNSIYGKNYVGGAVGENSGTVTACIATGNVKGEKDWVGGVVGYNRTSGTVTASYHALGSVSGEKYVGGVVGNDSGIVTTCYWSDSPDNDGDMATKVDGTTVTWQQAVNAMNTAIETWNTANPDEPCDKRYELTGELPTLKKEE